MAKFTKNTFYNNPSISLTNQFGKCHFYHPKLKTGVLKRPKGYITTFSYFFLKKILNESIPVMMSLPISTEYSNESFSASTVALNYYTSSQRVGISSFCVKSSTQRV